MYYQWYGESDVAPIESNYVLTNTNGLFAGTAFFSVAGWSGDPLTDTLEISVPASEIEQFLHQLGQAPTFEGTYKPSVPTVDDFPTYRIIIRTTQATFKFYTQSQGEFHTPWGLTLNESKDFTITRKEPMLAINQLYQSLPTERLEQLINQAWLRKK